MSSDITETLMSINRQMSQQVQQSAETVSSMGKPSQALTWSLTEHLSAQCPHFTMPNWILLIIYFLIEIIQASLSLFGFYFLLLCLSC